VPETVRQRTAKWTEEGRRTDRVWIYFAVLCVAVGIVHVSLAGTGRYDGILGVAYAFEGLLIGWFLWRTRRRAKLR
jgi:hypothetical protein